MQSFQLEEIKSFMGKLLASELFDSYLLSEATISTFQTFHIDGHINKDFYKETEPTQEETYFLETGYSTWKQMRPYCFDLIKGKRTPLGFRFILAFPVNLAQSLLEPLGIDTDSVNLKTFLVNIRYDGTRLLCVTASSSKDFMLGKQADHIWDQYFGQFLTSHGISYIVS